MNPFSTIALENLVYFAAGMLAGLLAGKLIGWARRRFGRARTATNLGSSNMTGQNQRGLCARGPRALAIIAASILLFGAGVHTGFKVLEHEYNCLDDFANETADAQEARQADLEILQERDNAAWRAIEDLFAQKDPEGKKLRQAVLARIRAADQLQETRAENPNPPPPREVC